MIKTKAIEIETGVKLNKNRLVTERVAAAYMRV